MRLLFALAIAASLALCGAAEAQTAHFTAAQQVIPTSALNQPNGVAVSSGFIYIADSANGRVLVETPPPNSASGEPTLGYLETTYFSGWTYPQAVAAVPESTGIPAVVVADRTSAIGSTYTSQIVEYSFPNEPGLPTVRSVVASGSFNATGVALSSNSNGVYFIEADKGLVVVATPSSSGAAFTQTTIASGLGQPGGIAADANGNLYVTDTKNNQILKETYSSSLGTYTQSVIASTGLDAPVGIAVDGNGVLYVSEPANGLLLTETPSGGSYTQKVVAPFPNSNAVAIDNNGALYATDLTKNEAVEDTLSNPGFGPVAVRSSSLMSFIFTFDSGGSIGSPTVLTQGITGLDFTDAGTGTCDTNGTSHTYSAGDTCTVNVTLTPRFAGTRVGAVLLSDTSGNVINSTYTNGEGLAPQLMFLPGTQSTAVSGLSSPVGTAVDTKGNLYFANTGNGQLIKETLSGGSYTQSTIASGLSNLWQVAVDGRGAVYAAQTANGGAAGRVIKETPSGSGYGQSTIGGGLVAPSGVAVDSFGDVFIADPGMGEILEEVPSGSSYVQKVVLTGGSSSPMQIAVDLWGNLLITNWIAGELVENGQTVIDNSLSSPYGVTVDAQGTHLYVADSGNNRVLAYVNGVTKVIATNLNSPKGLAADDAGNVYIADTSNGRAVKVDLADGPSVTFASTPFGQTSSDSPRTVTLTNIGTFPLQVIPSGNNFASISPSFNLGTIGVGGGSNDCPWGTSNPFQIFVNAGCAVPLSISFQPMAVGPITGSLTLTDNNLNAGAPNYPTQTIALSGTGTKATATIDWTPPSSIVYGTDPLTVFNAVAVSGSSGTIPLPGTMTYTATPSGGTATPVSNITVLGVGQYTLTASFTPTSPAEATGATTTVSVVVTQAAPAIVLSSSVPDAFLSNAVAFTANVTAGSGTPTGTVSFYDGTTLLGQVNVAADAAVYTTSSLAAGNHSVTAVYSGDGNDASETSSAVAETIQDFTLTSNQITTVVVPGGGEAEFPLVITPQDGSTTPADITLSVTGLPTGVTGVFSPAKVAAGSGTTNVTLTVGTSGMSSLSRPSFGFGKTRLALAFALVLLPLGRVRRISRRLRRMSVLLIVLAAGLCAVGLSGCGGGSSSKSGGGGSSDPVYTLTVTGTSGTLSHSVNVTFQVQ